MSDLFLYEDVEPGSAAKFVSDLGKNADADVVLHVSSYGGDVFEGLVIMNALRSHSGNVTAIVEGVAASIASVIVVGGADRVVMRPGSRMMIHNALTMTMGNADELDATSRRLREMSSDLAQVYAQRSGTDVAEWQAAMDAETWFSADEAVAAGLADVVEDGRLLRDENPVAAGSRMMNVFKGRRGAPPAHLLNRNSEEGDTVALTKEDIVAIIRSELQGFKNEAVPIAGEVEVSYPADVKIVPTEKIKVDPIIGDKAPEPAEGDVDPAIDVVENVEPEGDSAAVQLAKQAGLTFAIGDVAEGFTAEVDEGGVVTITAPSGAEVGSTAAFTVLVNDTSVALNVTVRSLSEEPEDEPADEPAAPVEPGAVEKAEEALLNKRADTVDEMVSVPRAHFEWLNKAAALTADVQAKVEASEREAEVDKWIREEGRFSASLRSKALADHEKNPEQARRTWGSLPKNTVPRSEVGYGRESAEEVDHEAAALRKAANPFPKPKF